MIKYVVGDAVYPVGKGIKIIAHICNNVGKWGKGFVLAVSKRWPETYYRYVEWHKRRGSLNLGAIQIIRVESDILVFNMVAQEGIFSKGTPPIRYSALDVCLEKLSGTADCKNASIHMPRIGCGLAGGKWSKIETLIDEKLSEHSVTVYDLK